MAALGSSRCSGSTERLGRFALAVPGVAEWVGGIIPPGSSTPELHFDAVGLPGIVTYWAGGIFVFPSRDEENNNSPEPDPLATEMINGQTVGVDSWPADRTAKALIARLRRLTQRTCGVNRLADWLLKINADIVVSVL